MRQLLLKSLFMAALVTATYALLLFVVPDYEDGFNAARADKRALLERTAPPRLIITGGSNAVTGIDSGRLAAPFGLHPVNMSLHAGLGLRFMLDELRGEIAGGDVIVVAPEYSHFSELLDGNQPVADILDLDPGAARHFRSPNQVLTALRFAPQTFKAKLKRFVQSATGGLPPGSPPDPVYHRGAFNECGDMISHLDLPSRDISGDRDIMPLPPDRNARRAISCLNDFAAHAESRGARVLVFPPSVSEEHLNRNAENVAALEAMLREELNVPLVAEPRRYAFRPEEMYDTKYHLNGEGRRRRTLLMIEDLRAYPSPAGDHPAGMSSM